MDKNRYLNIRMTQKLYEAIQKLANADRRTVSDYVRIILEDYVEAKSDEK